MNWLWWTVTLILTGWAWLIGWLGGQTKARMDLKKERDEP